MTPAQICVRGQAAPRPDTTEFDPVVAIWIGDALAYIPVANIVTLIDALATAAQDAIISVALARTNPALAAAVPAGSA